MTVWNVKLEVLGFESKEAAKAFQDALQKAFCAMPEAEGYEAISSYYEDKDCEALASFNQEIETLTAQ